MARLPPSSCVRSAEVRPTSLALSHGASNGRHASVRKRRQISPSLASRTASLSVLVLSGPADATIPPGLAAKNDGPSGRTLYRR
jgi:hypothetical protein